MCCLGVGPCICRVLTCGSFYMCDVCDMKLGSTLCGYSRKELKLTQLPGLCCEGRGCIQSFSAREVGWVDFLRPSCSERRYQALCSKKQVLLLGKAFVWFFFFPSMFETTLNFQSRFRHGSKSKFSSAENLREHLEWGLFFFFLVGFASFPFFKNFF